MTSFRSAPSDSRSALSDPSRTCLPLNWYAQITSGFVRPANHHRYRLRLFISNPPLPRPYPTTSTSAAQKAHSPSLDKRSTVRQNDESGPESVSSCPKREIHPPLPQDIDSIKPAASKRPKIGKKGSRVRDDGTLDQLSFCVKIINDLYKKQYSDFAFYLYNPVGE